MNKFENHDPRFNQYIQTVRDYYKAREHFRSGALLDLTWETMKALEEKALMRVVLVNQ